MTVLVVECLGTLLGRLMEQAWDGAQPGTALVAEPRQTCCRRDSRWHAPRASMQRLRRSCEREGDTIVVTNEVGDGVVPAYATGRLFRDLLGRANRTLVDSADSAYLVVAGGLLDLKPRFRALRTGPTTDTLLPCT